MTAARKRDEYLSRFPVTNILVHTPGEIEVRARYNYVRQPLTLRRIQETRRCDLGCSVPSVKMSDIGTRDIGVFHHSSVPDDEFHDLWRLQDATPWQAAEWRRPDYATILAAIEMIRDVHGDVPVQWNLHRDLPPPALRKWGKPMEIDVYRTPWQRAAVGDW